MKKILIATSALAAFTATSVFALDVKTTGSVEYKYSKSKVANKTENPKLKHGTTEVKFAAEGASNGLAYGAWVKVKNGGGKSDAAKVTNGTSDTASTSNINKHSAPTWGSDGSLTAVISKDTAAAAFARNFTWKAPVGAVQGAPANNAVTQSAMWVSGSFGKIVIGQAGDAGHAPSGEVKAASFETGSTVAASSTGTVGGERITYEAPALVDGLAFSYTTSLKGNTSTTKTDKATAPSQWGISYKTAMAGVSVKVGHSVGKTSGKKNETIKVESGESNYTKTWNVVKNNSARTNTATGVELGYGNFTVGYGTFTNGKKFNQTKSTGGSAYGVKYASGDWSVGYTVKESEDNNKYTTVKKQSAETSAYSASYTVASGFSVYASKSSNSKKVDGTTTKNNYTIIGGKISF